MIESAIFFCDIFVQVVTITEDQDDLDDIEE